MVKTPFINHSIMCRFGLFFLIAVTHFSACHYFEHDDNLLDLSFPYGRISVDVLNSSETYYLLGLRIFDKPDSTLFLVDHSVTFGREINVIFGNKSVSILPFARNAKIIVKKKDLKHAQVRKKVTVEYDLHGVHIARNYIETRFSSSKNMIPLGGTISFEKDSGVTRKTEAETQSTPSSTTYIDEEIEEPKGDDEDEDVEEIVEEKGVTDDGGSFSATDWVKSSIVRSSHTGVKVDFSEDLSSTAGFHSKETLAIESLDYTCVVVDNTEELHTKAFFKDCKLPLSKGAKTFEVCYVYKEPSTDRANILVTSIFDKVSVEQHYICSYRNQFKPALDFSPFKDLKSHYARNKVTASGGSRNNPFNLNIGTFEGNDYIEKITYPKNVSFRYVDGKEYDDENDRTISVANVTFGSTTFDIPKGRTFVMASRCNPYTATYYVSIMLKNGVFYENYIWHSTDDFNYQENKKLNDAERLEIIEHSSKVWKHREYSGKMGYLSDPLIEEDDTLCISQFTTLADTSELNVQKKLKLVSEFPQYEVLLTSKTFTALKLLKNSHKSNMLIGNCYFELSKRAEDTLIYVSHAPHQPINVLIHHSPSEHYSVVETGYGTNIFASARNVFDDASAIGLKSDVNLNKLDTYYGITWNINMLEKNWTLYPKNFPYCLIGDIIFKNMRIVSHDQEGYKHLVAPRRDQLSSIKVFVRHPESKRTSIKVTAETNNGTSLDFKSEL